MIKNYVYACTALLLMLLFFSACQYKKITTYSPSGSLESKYKQHRKTQEKEGPYLLYFEDGKIAIHRIYKKGKLSGEELVYHPNGALQKKAMAVNGTLNGPFIYYYDNGIIHQEGFYKNDRIHDTLKTYYKSGVLKEFVIFVDGDENGAIHYYYPSGKLHYTGYLFNGDNKHGAFIYYDEEGNIYKKESCLEGTCHTTFEK